MDALFAREVQFFVRPSGKLLRCPKGSNQSSIKTVNQRLEENVSEDLQAGNSAEFSKPQIPLPDRQFESVPLRHTLLIYKGFWHFQIPVDKLGDNRVRLTPLSLTCQPNRILGNLHAMRSRAATASVEDRSIQCLELHCSQSV
jgi:hypothetical protein